VLEVVTNQPTVRLVVAVLALMAFAGCTSAGPADSQDPPTIPEVSDTEFLLEDESGNLEFRYAVSGSDAHVYAQSLRPWDQTMQVSMHGDNMTSADSFPKIVELPANQMVLLTTFTVVEHGE
jgi:hypothetical protein